MENWIQENPNMFFGLFIGVCAVFIIIFIVVGILNKAKKKKLLQGNENLAELVFDYVVSRPSPVGGVMGRSTGYIVYAVNGEQPRIFGRSVLVPAGEVTLDCEYCYQTAGKSFATSFGRSTYRLTVLSGKKYAMSFNYIEKTLEHKEK
ncbi:MAG: hypothetical protein ACK5JF_12045 [Oscillospiraceae bacterium]